MVVSKRIQVLLKPHLNKAVEELAEQQGESVSRMTALLVQEALTTRGLNPSVHPHVPPELQDAMQQELTAVERGWTPSEGLEGMKEKTPEWSEPEPVPETRTDEAQLMKLKLMQDLMEQLKDM